MESAAGERRRCVRQKIHSPAYASLEEKSELSEILDISEEGAAIQTSVPPELNQAVKVCLDLSETRNLIHCTGRVVRLDGAGRAAIHFPDMPDPERQQLKEWLFLNAMMAGVNQMPEPAHSDEDEAPSDFTSRLMALAAVRREVEAKASDLDGALDLVAERALSFTSASGAAIALSRGTDMVCVASSGAQAPPLESCLQIGSGFSGECIRSGKLMRCDDVEGDSRVDQESCRMLGIRSMIAVPIYRGMAVIGLLEVFSPKPHGFGADAEAVLRDLSETTTQALKRAGLLLTGTSAERATGGDREEIDSQLKASWISSHRAILVGVAAVVLLAALIVFTTRWRKPQVQPTAQTTNQKPLVSPQATTDGGDSSSGINDLQRLLTLAGQGDPGAQFAVGARYATGQEVKQDYAEAIRWFTQAAEQGHVVSQATLGAYYWAGRGVPPDLEKAYYWSILAQNGGDQASKYRVAVLTSRMTHTQLASAQQQADDWIRQHESLRQAAKRERLPQ